MTYPIAWRYCENEDNSLSRNCVSASYSYAGTCRHEQTQCALAATLVPRVNQTNRDNHSLRAFSVAGHRGLASPISERPVFPLVVGGSNVEVTRTANMRTVVLVSTAIYFVLSFFCALRRKLHLPWILVYSERKRIRGIKVACKSWWFVVKSFRLMEKRPINKN